MISLIFLSFPAFADKQLKDDFKSIGHGFRDAGKGVGHASKHAYQKTKKWVKGNKEKAKKD